MNLPCRLSGPIWPGFRIVISPERVGARAAGPTKAAAVKSRPSIANGHRSQTFPTRDVGALGTHVTCAPLSLRHPAVHRKLVALLGRLLGRHAAPEPLRPALGRLAAVDRAAEPDCEPRDQGGPAPGRAQVLRDGANERERSVPHAAAARAPPAADAAPVGAGPRRLQPGRVHRPRQPAAARRAPHRVGPLRVEAGGDGPRRAAAPPRGAPRRVEERRAAVADVPHRPRRAAARRPRARGRARAAARRGDDGGGGAARDRRAPPAGAVHGADPEPRLARAARARRGPGEVVRRAGRARGPAAQLLAPVARRADAPRRDARHRCARRRRLGRRAARGVRGARVPDGDQGAAAPPQAPRPVGAARHVGRAHRHRRRRRRAAARPRS